MATSLAAKVTLKLAHSFTDALDLSTPTDALLEDFSNSFANGTSDDQCDVQWHDQRTLAATSEDLDLAGVLVDSLGNTVTFAKVRMLFIKNNSTTTTQTLSVGGAAANAFSTFVSDSTDKIVLAPTGWILLHAPQDGYVVTAGTGDQLKIDSGANTFTYDIIIWGTSA